LKRKTNRTVVERVSLFPFEWKNQQNGLRDGTSVTV